MRHLLPRLFLLGSALLTLLLTQANAQKSVVPLHPSGKADTAKLTRAYGQLPLAFEPNVGQTDHRVRFHCKNDTIPCF